MNDSQIPILATLVALCVYLAYRLVKGSPSSSPPPESNHQDADSRPPPPSCDLATWAKLLGFAAICTCVLFGAVFETVTPEGIHNLGLMQVQTLGYHTGLALLIAAVILGCASPRR